MKHLNKKIFKEEENDLEWVRDIINKPFLPDILDKTWHIEVANEKDSEEVQNLLFNLGYIWPDGDKSYKPNRRSFQCIWKDNLRNRTFTAGYSTTDWDYKSSLRITSGEGLPKPIYIKWSEGEYLNESEDDLDWLPEPIDLNNPDELLKFLSEHLSGDDRFEVLKDDYDIYEILFNGECLISEEYDSFTLDKIKIECMDVLNDEKGIHRYIKPWYTALWQHIKDFYPEEEIKKKLKEDHDLDWLPEPMDLNDPDELLIILSDLLETKKSCSGLPYRVEKKENHYLIWEGTEALLISEPSNKFNMESIKNTWEEVKHEGIKFYSEKIYCEYGTLWRNIKELY